MTHGSILLKEGRRKLLLQTYHDGHTIDALWMLFEIPELICKNREWVVRLAKDKLQKSNKEDFLRCLEGFAFFEWNILDFASLVVASKFNRWRVVPNNFYKQIPEYDLDPRIVVELKKDRSFVSCNNFKQEQYDEIQEEFTEFNKNFENKIIWNNDKFSINFDAMLTEWYWIYAQKEASNGN